MADCPAGIGVTVTVAGDSIKQITYREHGCVNRLTQLTVGNLPVTSRKLATLSHFSARNAGVDKTTRFCGRIKSWLKVIVFLMRTIVQKYEARAEIGSFVRYFLD